MPEKDKSPIKSYMEKYCLPCEEEGKCEYDRIGLCVSIREMNYARDVYKLKYAQMKELGLLDNIENLKD